MCDFVHHEAFIEFAIWQRRICSISVCHLPTSLSINQPYSLVLNIKTSKRIDTAYSRWSVRDMHSNTLMCFKLALAKQFGRTHSRFTNKLTLFLRRSRNIYWHFAARHRYGLVHASAGLTILGKRCANY